MNPFNIIPVGRPRPGLHPMHAQGVQPDDLDRQQRLNALRVIRHRTLNRHDEGIGLTDEDGDDLDRQQLRLNALRVNRHRILNHRQLRLNTLRVNRHHDEGIGLSDEDVDEMARLFEQRARQRQHEF